MCDTCHDKLSQKEPELTELERELLEALKDCYRSYTEGSEFDLDVRPLIEKMKAVIAKAEGRTP